jgi:hypothetical protein
MEITGKNHFFTLITGSQTTPTPVFNGTILKMSLLNLRRKHHQQAHLELLLSLIVEDLKSAKQENTNKNRQIGSAHAPKSIDHHPRWRCQY